MTWENFDPVRVVQMVEERFGQPGKWLVNGTIIAAGLGIISWGLKWFLDDLVGGVLWPFFARLLDIKSTTVTLDNIGALITTLAFSLLILAVFFLVLLLLIYFALRQRAIPQRVLDRLGEFRAEGINTLFTRKPTNDQELNEWAQKHVAWENKIKDYMKKKHAPRRLFIF